jgi:hypothetical protein
MGRYLDRDVEFRHLGFFGADVENHHRKSVFPDDGFRHRRLAFSGIGDSDFPMMDSAIGNRPFQRPYATGLAWQFLRRPR